MSMDQKTIELVISLRDKLTADLKKMGAEGTKALGGCGRAAKEATGEIAGTTRGFGNLATAIKAFIGLQAVRETYLFLKNVSWEAARAERAFNQLGLAYANTGRMFVGGDVRKFAEDMQALTASEDDTVIATMALLSNLTDLNEKGIVEATKLSIGLSKVFGEDLMGSAQIVAQYLNTGMTRAVRRFGLSVDEDASTPLERLNGLLDDQGKFLKQAMDLSSDTIGINQRLGNSWGNLKEALGDGLNPTLNETKNLLTDMLDRATEWLNMMNKLNQATPTDKRLKYLQEIKSVRETGTGTAVPIGVPAVEARKYLHMSDLQLSNEIENLQILKAEAERLKGRLAMQTYTPYVGKDTGDRDRGGVGVIKETTEAVKDQTSAWERMMVVLTRFMTVYDKVLERQKYMVSYGATDPSSPNYIPLAPYKMVDFQPTNKFGMPYGASGEGGWGKAQRRNDGQNKWQQGMKEMGRNENLWGMAGQVGQTLMSGGGGRQMIAGLLPTIGSAFGPIGSIIGALAGGLIGAGGRRGEVPASPVYVQDVQTRDILVELLNITKMGLTQRVAGYINNISMELHKQVQLV